MPPPPTIVVEVGDDVSECVRDKAVLMCNHQSTFDVPLIFTLLHDYQKGDLGKHYMWILDRMFFYTHFGAVCSIRGDFFIKQVMVYFPYCAHTISPSCRFLYMLSVLCMYSL